LATGGLDALADALPDAAEDEYPEPPQCPDEGAGKLADPVPDVQEPDAQEPQPEQLARPALSEPCTPDAAQYGARSCVVAALGDAVAQLAQLFSSPRERRPVAAPATEAVQKLEPQIVLPEPTQLAYGSVAQAVPVEEQRRRMAALLAALELKMSVSV
jgi:hypothetical protein